MVRIVPVILAIPFRGSSGTSHAAIGEAMGKASDSRVFEAPVIVCSETSGAQALLEETPPDATLLLVPSPSSGAFAAVAGCLLAGRRFSGAPVLLLSSSSDRSDLHDYTRDIFLAARTAGPDGVTALYRANPECGDVLTGDYLLACSSPAALCRNVDENIVRYALTALDAAFDEGCRVTLGDTPYFAGGWPSFGEALAAAGVQAERFWHRHAPAREWYSPWRTYDGAAGFYGARSR